MKQLKYVVCFGCFKKIDRHSALDWQGEDYCLDCYLDTVKISQIVQEQQAQQDSQPNKKQVK